jgi:hypothetical protein
LGTTTDTGTIEVTAQWTENQKYDILWNCDGGNKGKNPETDYPDQYTYGLGMTFDEVPIPTKSGCTFAGWNPTSITAIDTDTIEVTAQWEAKKTNEISSNSSWDKRKDSHKDPNIQIAPESLAGSHSEIEGLDGMLQIVENEESGTVITVQATTTDGEPIGDPINSAVEEDLSLVQEEPDDIAPVDDDYDDVDDDDFDDDIDGIDPPSDPDEIGPGTGDSSQILLFALLGIASLSEIIVIARKRVQNNQ